MAQILCLMEQKVVKMSPSNGCLRYCSLVQAGETASHYLKASMHWNKEQNAWFEKKNTVCVP